MKIAITGDLYLEHPDTIVVDESVKEIMSTFDYRILNLEGSLYNSIDKSVVSKKSGPSLKQPDGVLRIVDELGADVLTLANNHVMDYGNEGYQQTTDLIRNRFESIGCGSWDEAYSLHVIKSDKLRVGVLNFCEMQFGMLYDKWTQSNSDIGCAWINHPIVDEHIRRYKPQVDKLIAICHAGVEMMKVPIPEWRTRYRQLVDLGCDAVIAHHPHVVQGYEIYNGAPICYSLGNFCFVRDGSSNANNWNTGAVAVLDITHEGVGLETFGVQTLKRTTLSLVSREIWNDYIEKLNHFISEEEYMDNVNEECLRLLEDYYYILSMGGVIRFDKHWMKNIARLLLHKYDPVHLLNIFQCESHRWCISRALRLKDNQII